MEVKEILKKADWYYQYIDGLEQWIKGKASYTKAIDALVQEQDNSIQALLTKYVPKDLHETVRQDIKRKRDKILLDIVQQG